jgi:SAM-dependent methyltransferase
MAFAVTRGYGLLESFLAGQRSRVANNLLRAENNKERILDIGCGTYPLFLISSNFSEKYGLDQVMPYMYKNSRGQKIDIINHDIEKGGSLPFEGNYFSAVTMLAVIEHIKPQSLMELFKEIHRILIPGGMCVITVPTAWTGGLLKTMAAFKLVSPVEIEEHKNMLWPSQIIGLLHKSGFAKERARCGFFEIFMNTWVTIKK